MPACPTCGQTSRQHKAGANSTGTARRQCQHCHRTYTPEPKRRGYEDALRHKALKLYVDGLSFRRIARHLQVHHQSIVNGVNAAAANLPAPPTPHERLWEQAVDTLEMDELFTFVGQKKNQPTS